LFHFTQTAHGAHFSDRVVIGFPPSGDGVGHRASLGVVFRAGSRFGSPPETPASHPPRTLTVLSLSPAENDHAVLRRCFRDTSLTLYPNRRLRLQPSPTLSSTLSSMRAHRIPIVLCDGDAQPEAWREILRAGKLLSAPPCVIVTSRRAGDRLWMELLNEGAFDLLSKPFDPSEAVRIVHSAWVHWRNRYQLAEGA
jgi:CheY-like chemotaxis protein